MTDEKLTPEELRSLAHTLKCAGFPWVEARPELQAKLLRIAEREEGRGD